MWHQVGIENCHIVLVHILLHQSYLDPASCQISVNVFDGDNLNIRKWKAFYLYLYFGCIDFESVGKINKLVMQFWMTRATWCAPSFLHCTRPLSHQGRMAHRLKETCRHIWKLTKKRCGITSCNLHATPKPNLSIHFQHVTCHLG